MDDFTRSFIGRTIPVLCETKDEEGGLLVGRSYADSPDIAGCVLFEGFCPFGEFAEVLIDDAEDGVLYGRGGERMSTNCQQDYRFAHCACPCFSAAGVSGICVRCIRRFCGGVLSDMLDGYIASRKPDYGFRQIYGSSGG